MKWYTQLSAVTLAGLMAWTPVAAQAQTLQMESAPAVAQAHVELPIDVDSISLAHLDTTRLAQLDRREGQTVEDLKRDPARAVLLSTLYPGLGQLYIGNDNSRSLIIMGAGSLIIIGSIAGFVLLADRPAEASTLGNILIIGVLVGYHLWNIRDAYVQADEYNKLIENQSRLSWLSGFNLGMQRDTLTLSWSASL